MKPTLILIALATLAGFALCRAVTPASPAMLPGPIEMRQRGGRRFWMSEPSSN